MLSLISAYPLNPPYNLNNQRCSYNKTGGMVNESLAHRLTPSSSPSPCICMENGDGDDDEDMDELHILSILQRPTLLRSVGLL